MLKSHWKLAVFTMLFLPVLISLGIWQLNRAEQKQQWLDQLAQGELQAPVTLEQLNQEIPGETNNLPAVQHRKVAIYGHFLSEPLFFLDNKMRHSRPGFEVIVPFAEAETNKTVWLNIGWIASINRTTPQISLPKGPIKLYARVYRIPKKSWLLKQLFPKKLPLLKQTQQIISYPYLTDLYAFIGTPPAYPFLLRLMANQPGALNTAWTQPEDFSPQKHQAYAFQWFALALTLVLLYLMALFQHIKNKRTKH